MAFGVYIHIPYCVTKCPYCDFNSHGVGNSFPEGEYSQSVLGELELYADHFRGRRVTSIFFGGGTPSLFDPSSIGRIISKVYELASVSDEAEISLEVNPKTADVSKLKGLRDAGVNRVSVGIQSFSERKLKFLGRINTPEDSRQILKDVIAAGFDNFNFDLMYGTTGETSRELRSDLEQAVGFGSNHISAYCLTIEDGTAFGKMYKLGKLKLPKDERLSEFITYTSQYLETAGYGRYEISNFAKPGFECRHNLLYWNSDEYLGVGAGAHSHLNGADNSWGTRWGNIRNPSSYIKAVAGGDKPVDFLEELQKQEALEDRIIMGMRLQGGLDIEEIEARYGVTPNTKQLAYIIEDGYLERSDNYCKLTEKGNLFSNEIILRLVDSLEPCIHE